MALRYRQRCCVILHGALARKDGAEIGRLTRAFPESRREGLRALPHLFGDIEVLKDAEQALGLVPGISGLLGELKRFRPC